MTDAPNGFSTPMNARTPVNASTAETIVLARRAFERRAQADMLPAQVGTLTPEDADVAAEFVE